MVRVETPEQAVELLERAVEAKGADYKYVNPMGSPGCYYVHIVNDVSECGCIVGCALALHGWTMDELRQCDSSGGILGVATRFSDQFGPDVPETFQAAQRVQDGGYVPSSYDRGTWGEALAVAREYAANLRENDDK